MAVVALLPLWVWGQSSPGEFTTTLSVGVCGDGVISTNEVCDDGSANNDGAYATSTATRRCNASCSGYGPYCGDDILQTLFGEECDDGNNIDGDLCSAVCLNEAAPTTNPGGGGGGGGGGGSSGGKDPDGAPEGTIDVDAPTEVQVEGMAYPGAAVSILVDGEVEKEVSADDEGEFSYTFRAFTPGVATFGFRAEDPEGRKSITYTSTIEVAQGAQTTISTILVPPTIAAVPEKVALGQSLTFQGYAAPEHSVEVLVDNAITIATTSARDGAWAVAFTTDTLENERFHSAKARYRNPRNLESESGFSQLVGFYVGIQDVDIPISPDINQDGRVDLIDFSILLFEWSTAAARADFDRDGTVGLADFSIMLFYWTG